MSDSYRKQFVNWLTEKGSATTPEIGQTFPQATHNLRKMENEKLIQYNHATCRWSLVKQENTR